MRAKRKLVQSFIPFFFSLFSPSEVRFDQNVRFSVYDRCHTLVTYQWLSRKVSISESQKKKSKFFFEKYVFGLKFAR